MVLTKEYRICMPISVEEYQIGQLYMIARHSLEQSGDGEGVEVVENRECEDPEHGKGHFTEKRIHLSSRLPYWIQSMIPKIFYITEKAWNYYPYTVTEYNCSFIPRFHISIKTRYENNNGSTDNYQIGQLYMIARHSLEQSGDGEGVEVVENRECEDPEHGKGHFTEKRIHLSSRLPYWIQSMIPKIFYITEKAWNYYPYTVTEYNCSFIPRFHISIKTRYENNNGSTDNCLKLTPEALAERIVEHVDIAYDEVSAKHYKEEEDPRFFRSEKTHRGPLVEGWRNTHQPIMCSYKLVSSYFEVWGLQTKVEDFIHSCIREILLLGHRQAFAWIDSWVDMTYEDVKEYEKRLQLQTNTLVRPQDDVEPPAKPLETDDAAANQQPAVESPQSPKSIDGPKSPDSKKGYFSSWFS